MARHNFRDILVWQKARKTVKEIYIITVNFPNEEKFGIISQLRRAIISVPTNIAEGARRGTDKDFSRFLDFAEGSSNEVISLLFLSFDLSFIKESVLNGLVEKMEEINRMINGFRNNLNNR